MKSGLFLSACFGAVLLSAAAFAQSSGPFGGFKHDRKAPIEITSDALEVRQAEQLAIFTGEVVAGQGTLRLTADRVEVLYDENNESDSETGAIKNMMARGSVFLSNGAETAQGEWAEYDVSTGMVRMGGAVILTQGANAIKGEKLVINLDSGQAKMEASSSGRVTSIFTPKSDDADGAETDASETGASDSGTAPASTGN